MAASESSPIRILLVEDNRFDVELIRVEFNRANFQAEIQATDTEQATMQALSADLDLIIADHSLPMFEGFAVFDMLKETGFSVPVIIMSGVFREDLSARAEESGAAAYLAKDSLSEITTIVKDVLSQS